MSWTGESNAITELRAHWHEWTRIVGLFARRRRARRSVDARGYAELQAELVGACRSLEEMADAEDKPYFRSLEQLAGPWVSIQSFRATDREILEGLFRRCLIVERELGGRTWSLPDLRRPVRVFFSLTATAAAIFLLWTAGQAWSPILEQGRSWSDAVRICMERTAYVHNLLIPALIVVCTSSYMISRTARH